MPFALSPGNEAALAADIGRTNTARLSTIRIVRLRQPTPGIIARNRRHGFVQEPASSEAPGQGIWFGRRAKVTNTVPR
jgi:hypothetical protein